MDNKIITLPQEKTIKEKVKEKKDRLILEKEKWDLEDEYFEPTIQYEILINKTNTKVYKKMIQQIQRKISSYKAQDKEKKLFDNEKFINMEIVLEKIEKCTMKCFYCSDEVKILYKAVKDPKQWSIERINNDYGHNSDNFEIACLKCNLNRKTMYHERYLFTKQLNIVKNDI